MNQRQEWIQLACIAGYHGDGRAYLRIMSEARVNRETLARAWRAGERAKAQGVRCTCRQCNGAQAIDGQFRDILQLKP